MAEIKKKIGRGQSLPQFESSGIGIPICNQIIHHFPNNGILIRTMKRISGLVHTSNPMLDHIFFLLDRTSNPLRKLE